MMDLHFDPTIRYGDIVTAITCLCVGVGAIVGIRYQLKFVSWRLDLVDATLEDVKVTVKNDILQNEQISQLKAENVALKLEFATLRNELYNLRSGKGWIAEEVNGEYTRTGKVRR